MVDSGARAPASSRSMAVWNMESNEYVTETRQTAEAIIASLRQAADLAKRN
jgi:hypothetical protein